VSSRYRHEAESFVAPDGMPVDFVPNRHRSFSASRDSWEILDRPVRGIAPSTLEDGSADGSQTVDVYYADGTHEVRTVSSFTARHRYQRAPQQSAPRELTEAERFLPSAVEILGDYS
jgi:hypothetical protein